MSAAKVLRLPEPERTAEGYRDPDVFDRVSGNSRAIAVAKFRELADKLESGELDGASVEWRRCKGEILRGDTRLVHCTVQADSEYRVGKVQLTFTTIEEG